MITHQRIRSGFLSKYSTQTCAKIALQIHNSVKSFVSVDSPRREYSSSRTSVTEREVIYSPRQRETRTSRYSQNDRKITDYPAPKEKKLERDIKPITYLQNDRQNFDHSTPTEIKEKYTSGTRDSNSSSDDNKNSEYETAIKKTYPYSKNEALSSDYKRHRSRPSSPPIGETDGQRKANRKIRSKSLEDQKKRMEFQLEDIKTDFGDSGFFSGPRQTFDTSFEFRPGTERSRTTFEQSQPQQDVLDLPARPSQYESPHRKHHRKCYVSPTAKYRDDNTLKHTHSSLERPLEEYDNTHSRLDRSKELYEPQGRRGYSAPRPSRRDRSTSKSMQHKSNRSPRRPVPWEELDNYDYYKDLEDKVKKSIKSRLKRELSEPVYVDPPEIRDEPYYQPLWNEREKHYSGRRVPPEEYLLPPAKETEFGSHRSRYDTLSHEKQGTYCLGPRGYTSYFQKPKIRSSSERLEQHKETPFSRYADSGYYSPSLMKDARPKSPQKDVSFSLPEDNEIKKSYSEKPNRDALTQSSAKRPAESKVYRSSSAPIEKMEYFCFGKKHDSGTGSPDSSESQRGKHADYSDSIESQRGKYSNNSSSLESQKGKHANYSDRRKYAPYSDTELVDSEHYKEVQEKNDMSTYSKLEKESNREVYISPRDEKSTYSMKKETETYRSVSPSSSFERPPALPLPPSKSKSMEHEEKPHGSAYTKLMTDIANPQLSSYVRPFIEQDSLYKTPKVRSLSYESREDKDPVNVKGPYNSADTDDIEDSELDEGLVMERISCRNEQRKKLHLEPSAKSFLMHSKPYEVDSKLKDQPSYKSVYRKLHKEREGFSEPTACASKSDRDDSGFSSIHIERDDSFYDQLQQRADEPILHAKTKGDKMVSEYEKSKRNWERHQQKERIGKLSKEAAMPVTETQNSAYKTRYTETKDEMSSKSKTDTEYRLHVASPHGVNREPRMFEEEEEPTDDRIAYVPKLDLSDSGSSLTLDDLESEEPEEDAPLLLKSSSQLLRTGEIELAPWQREYLCRKTKRPKEPEEYLREETRESSYRMSERDHGNGIKTEENREETERTSCRVSPRYSAREDCDSLPSPEDIYSSSLPVMGKEQLKALVVPPEPDDKFPVRKIPQNTKEFPYVMIPMSKMGDHSCLVVPKRLCKKITMRSRDITDLTHSNLPESITKRLHPEKETRHTAKEARHMDKETRHMRREPNYTERETKHTKKEKHKLSQRGREKKETTCLQEEIRETMRSPRFSSEDPDIKERTQHKKTVKSKKIVQDR